MIEARPRALNQLHVSPGDTEGARHLTAEQLAADLYEARLVHAEAKYEAEAATDIFDAALAAATHNTSKTEALYAQDVINVRENMRLIHKELREAWAWVVFLNDILSRRRLVVPDEPDEDERSR